MRVKGFLRRPWPWLCGGIVLFGIAGYAWLERAWLAAEYHAAMIVRGSAAAQHDAHVAALARFDPHGWRALARYVDAPIAERRARSSAALAELLTRHVHRARAHEICTQLAADQAGRSPAGQAAVLECFLSILENATPEELDQRVKTAAAAFGNTSIGLPPAVQPAVQLALSLARRADPIDQNWLPAWRTWAECALRDEREEVLVAGIRLAMVPGVNALDAVRPCLRDHRHEVRVLALLAVGAREEIVPTDELLPFLHDGDPEVRSLCEQSLRTRGLTSSHVNLARDMTDARADVRARVASQVFRHEDLDARLWLERLSRDRSPAVRAAAARAAAQDGDGRFTTRLHQMALEDPSPTVRQIAEYYFSTRSRKRD